MEGQCRLQALPSGRLVSQLGADGLPTTLDWSVTVHWIRPQVIRPGVRGKHCAESGCHPARRAE